MNLFKRLFHSGNKKALRMVCVLIAASNGLRLLGKSVQRILGFTNTVFTENSIWRRTVEHDQVLLLR